MSHPEPSPHKQWGAVEAKAARRVVVVGGGPAAHRCVIELRKLGFDGSVVMVTAESRPPYDRTLLSKDNLAGGTASIAAMAPEGTYESLDVDVLLNRTATRLDPSAQSIALSDGSLLAYDRLLIAVGGAPIMPRALAAPGVLTMRTAEDIAPMRDALERSRHVVVVGAGFIGGEIAAAATEFGAAVTLIEAAGEPLEPILGAEVGRMVGDLHRSRGVDVRCRVQACSVRECGGSYRVGLADGTELQCDSVVIGVGMRPQIDWLRTSGIKTDRAILTDASCRTSVPGVLAAGDCAQWWSARYGKHCHVEHWDTAGKQGAAAARTIIGAPADFDPVPFFWSDQYDVKYQWAGHAPEWDQVQITGTAPTTFTASYIRDGQPIAAFVANQPKEFARLRRELLDAANSPDRQIGASNNKEVIAS